MDYHLAVLKLERDSVNKHSNPKMSKQRASSRGKPEKPENGNPEKTDKEGTPKVDRQSKLDPLVTVLNKDSTMNDLISTMNSFDQKLSAVASSLASREYIDKTLQKLVSQDLLKKAVREVKEDIVKQITSEIAKVNEHVEKVMSNIEARLDKQVAEILQLKNDQSDMQETINKLIEDNVTLTNRNKELKELVDQKQQNINRHSRELNDLQQYTRRNSIRIYGIEDTIRSEQSRQTIDTVIRIIKNKLDINLSHRDIDTAHRLGQFREDGNRPIICKFVSRETKYEVIRARKMLKGTTIVIREDLTQKNAKLLETVSRREEVQSAWSVEGKIVAMVQNGRKIHVGLDTDLSKPLYSP